MNASKITEVVTVTLNPAVDCMATVDGFTTGSVNRVSSYQNQPGGKGVNVAFSLRGLDHRVAVTGWLGQDNSRLFEDQFIATGVVDEFIRIPGSTRMAVKISDPKKQETTDVNFPGLHPDKTAQDELMHRIDALEATWIVLSGSVPDGISKDIYAEIIDRFKASGRKVLLDTSGEPLSVALRSAPNVIKPNVHELSEYLKRDLTSEESVKTAAQEMLDYGIELVVVSMGEKGALFVTRNEVITARSPFIQVHSTVGAGDAMVAGIIAGSLRGMSLFDMARLATASSLHVLSRRREVSGALYDLKPFLQDIMIT